MNQGNELIELDHEIQQLFSLFLYGIFPELELQNIVSIKKRKEEILDHEVLTRILKSRDLWIEQGDENNNFFHNFSSARPNHNNIWELMDGDGKTVSNLDQLKIMGKEHRLAQFMDDGNDLISYHLNVIKHFLYLFNEEYLKNMDGGNITDTNFFFKRTELLVQMAG